MAGRARPASRGVEASAEADLIVIGATRQRAHFGLQLSRAAHALLHHSQCPVAVVPQPVRRSPRGPDSDSLRRRAKAGGYRSGRGLPAS
ncbi:universal stress protein [Streptomyces umbrinus]|uniref:universal stress protein n=1 Tax=Streptomyces umbrinus TaxID=67370 RepID=UPI0016765CF9